MVVDKCFLTNVSCSLEQGGVVLVSHDERLIQMVCEELWVCSNRTVRSIEGGFAQYRKLIEEELAAQGQ